MGDTGGSDSKGWSNSRFALSFAAFSNPWFQLIDSNSMEVFSKYLRRLLQGNAGQIFPGAGRNSENSGSYSLLVSEMQKIRHDPQQASKIAESVDTPEGDLFRDFDLSTFMAHFKLDPVAKTTLALAFKSASKPDLRTKGEFSRL